jgi:hypothetical protein
MRVDAARARWARTGWGAVAGWGAAAAVVAAASVPALAGGATLSRGAMAEAVVVALRLTPTSLGPTYVDVPAGAAYAGAIAAGADAGLWPAWQPGARFAPAAPATLGQALSALVNGLGGGRAAADLPDGLRRTARLLGLWPPGAGALGARLTAAQMRWLSARARVAPTAALGAVDARLVRGIAWVGDGITGAPVGVNSTSYLGAVAVDAAGYALPVTVSVSASAGSENNAEQVFVAPARAGTVVLTARAPNGVDATLRVAVEGPLSLALLPAPATLPAGQSSVLEAGVTAGAGAFQGDSGRTLTLTVRQGAESHTQTAPDDFGLAPFVVPALRAGAATATLSAPGLASRTYDLRVARGGGAEPPSLSAPAPAALRGAANVFARKALWLPYWVWTATPLDRLIEEAKASGTSTIYLEVATSNNGVYGLPGLDRLLPAAQRAGLHVVAWIYADLARPATDFANLRTVARFRTPGGLRIDGLALDLEGSEPLPTWALAQELALARRLMGSAGPVLAVTYPAGSLAPPYGLIARYATAIAPMDYWHGLLEPMGYNVAYDEVAASIRAIRAEAPHEPVSVITQTFDIFTKSARGVYAPSAAELSGALQAAAAGGAEGVSFYEWGTISAAEWRVVDLPWPARAAS